MLPVEASRTRVTMEDSSYRKYSEKEMQRPPAPSTDLTTSCNMAQASRLCNNTDAHVCSDRSLTICLRTTAKRSASAEVETILVDGELTEK
jgi:hypothetical protein